MPSPMLRATSSKSSKCSKSSTSSTSGESASQNQEKASNEDEIEAQIREMVGPEEHKLLFTWLLQIGPDTTSSTSATLQQSPFASALLSKTKADLCRNDIKLHDDYFRYIACRTQQVDSWTNDFLNRHQYEDSLVLVLACGLDNRHSRVRVGADVKWIDVDSPRVAGIRERLLPRPEGDYELIAAHVGDNDAWLRSIPLDRPVLIIMESLLYFLEPEKGMLLLKRLLSHFRKGSILCDTFGSVSVTFASLVAPLNKKTLSPMRWGIDDAEDLVKLDGRLVLRDRIYSHEYLSEGWFAKGYPPLFGGWTPLISLLPKFKKNGQFLHFEF